MALSTAGGLQTAKGTRIDDPSPDAYEGTGSADRRVMRGGSGDDLGSSC
jgi:hypothetical protein